METIKTWQERMQDFLGDKARNYKADSYMMAEIADLRAALAQREASQQAGVACLQDVISHYSDFHAACHYRREACIKDGDAGNVAYWSHQIAVLSRMKQQAEDTLAQRAASVPDSVEVKPVADVDALAQFIRMIDGNNSMGAGALAEKISEWLAAWPSAYTAPPAPHVEAKRVDEEKLELGRVYLACPANCPDSPDWCSDWQPARFVGYKDGKRLWNWLDVQASDWPDIGILPLHGDVVLNRNDDPEFNAPFDVPEAEAAPHVERDASGVLVPHEATEAIKLAILGEFGLPRTSANENRVKRGWHKALKAAQTKESSNG